MGDFAPWKYLVMSGDIFSMFQCRGVYCSIRWVEGKVATKHPTMHSSSPGNKWSSPKS